MKKRIDTSAPPREPLHRPFAALAERLGALAPAHGAPAGPAESPAIAPAIPAPAPDAPAAGPARAVVRIERKGRGGKTATVVEKLDLRPAEREAWLSDLKRALGCGGALEGDALVLQGDVRSRVKAVLERRGVRKVTLG